MDEDKFDFTISIALYKTDEYSYPLMPKFFSNFTQEEDFINDFFILARPINDKYSIENYE